MGAVETNPTRTMRLWVRSVASLRWVGDPVFPGAVVYVGRRRSSDLALLWCRPVAASLIRPLAWEPPCASGVALKRQ